MAISSLGVILAGIGANFYYGYTSRTGWIGLSDKKSWGYLELLIVPAALAIGGYWLNQAQQEREAADHSEREREAQEAAQREREAKCIAPRASERRRSAASNTLVAGRS